MPEEEPTPDLTALTDRELDEAQCRAMADEERHERQAKQIREEQHQMVLAEAQAVRARDGASLRRSEISREIRRRVVERMEAA